MKHLFENFRSYLFEEELEEIKLKDLKKKYPGELTTIEYFINKGVENKYLEWAMKHYVEWKKKGFTVVAAEKIIDHSARYEKLLKTKKLDAIIKANGLDLKIKDINSFKNVNLVAFDKMITDWEAFETKGEKKKKAKEKAVEGSTIIYEDEDFFIVRPDTKSSCHFGRNTKWCISATTSQNYFEDYTSQGKTFYFLRNEHLSEEDDGKKIAFVYDTDGGLEEMFDALDTSISVSDAKWHVQRNLGHGNSNSEDPRFDSMANEKFKELASEMESHAAENPADTSASEEKYQEIEDMFNARADFTRISFEMDEGNIEFIGDTGFDFSELDWIVDPSDYESKINRIISDELSKENIYPGYVNFETHSGEYRVNISFTGTSEGIEGYSPDHFEQFADALEEHDGKMEEVKSNIIGELEEKTYVRGGAYMELKKMLQNAPDFKNLEIDIESGTIEISIPIRVRTERPTEPDKMRRFIEGKQFRNAYFNQIKRLVEKAEKYAAKQLSLSLTEEEIYVPRYHGEIKLTHFNPNMEPKNLLEAELVFEITRDLSHQDIKLIYGFAKYMDEKHDAMEELFARTLSSAEEFIDEQKTTLETLMEGWRIFLK